MASRFKTVTIEEVTKLKEAAENLGRVRLTLFRNKNTWRDD